jgi:uncharacterized protein (TIGR02453 family)
MTFKGFVDDKGTFFKQLAKNQDREWFKKNKSRYETEWAEPMLELLSEVREGIDDAYSYCDLDEPKLFRIHRDVRFGKDKSPYKTHIGGTISISGTGGVMDKPVALYLQLGNEPMAGAGHYMLPPDKLAKVRKAIAEDARGKELAKIVKALEKRGSSLMSAEKLVRVPKGFDADHPRAELLKMKGSSRASRPSRASRTRRSPSG